VRRGVGRPKDITDEDLFRARNFLVRLLDDTWPEVGPNLETFRMSLDGSDAIEASESESDFWPVVRALEIPRALQVWESETDLWPVVRALLRLADPQEDSGNLSALRHLLAQTTKSFLEQVEHRRKCQEDLERANCALATNLSKSEKRRITRIRATRARTSDMAQADYETIDKQLRDLQVAVQNAEARFAQIQLAMFCQDRRYRITPLRVANALAGLPFIGWRQSAKKCVKSKPDNVDLPGYETFTNITSMVKSWDGRRDLASHAKRWLRRKRTSSASRAIRELRNKFLFLKRSIEVVLSRTYKSEDLPWLVASEYSNQKRSPTQADIVLAKEARIRELYHKHKSRKHFGLAPVRSRRQALTTKGG
jgi:hypothetical protein